MDDIKRYLKDNLKIRIVDKKIELTLEDEVISSQPLEGDEKEKSDLLFCDSCGQTMPDSQFCITCSDPERSICLVCCNCM